MLLIGLARPPLANSPLERLTFDWFFGINVVQETVGFAAYAFHQRGVGCTIRQKSLVLVLMLHENLEELLCLGIAKLFLQTVPNPPILILFHRLPFPLSLTLPLN